MLVLVICKYKMKIVHINIKLYLVTFASESSKIKEYKMHQVSIKRVDNAIMECS